MLSRRGALALLAAGSSHLVWSRAATASLVRGVTLAELTQSSTAAIVGTALASSSRWERVAGRRRIVTYTRVRRDEHLAGQEPEGEVLIRTLGGQVGEVGQIVHGEAVLLTGEAAVLFLMPAESFSMQVTAMAQGHYPVREIQRSRRLQPSPRVGEIARDRERSAVQMLSGKELTQARRLISESWRSR